MDEKQQRKMYFLCGVFPWAVIFVWIHPVLGLFGLFLQLLGIIGLTRLAIASHRRHKKIMARLDEIIDVLAKIRVADQQLDVITGKQLRDQHDRLLDALEKDFPEEDFPKVRFGNRP